MSKRCLSCQTPFEFAPEDIDFLESVRPKGAVPIPPSKLCPDCRQLRRLAMNNETQLYHRKCDLSGSPIISIHSADKPYKVFRSDLWWSDEWSPLDYGIDYDPKRSFFEQFRQLVQTVPRAAVQTNYLLDENSQYTNYAGSNKNCYLLFHADLNRDCLYGYGVKQCESCLDVYNVFSSELVYESVDCSHCYNLAFSRRCTHCHDSFFLEDCISCKNCFGCKNLHQKQYCLFNRQVTKKEFETFLAENPLTTHKEIRRFQDKADRMFASLPNRFQRMQNCEDSAGDNLLNCKDVTSSFDIGDMRSGKYCYQVYNGARDCMDLYQFGLNAELVYDSSIIGINAYQIRFSHYCSEQIEDLTYCMHCAKAKHLFGCIGIRRKEYCILNKQYSRDDYEKLVQRITSEMAAAGEWGENFPVRCSPFGYNETTAQDYVPLTEEAAVAAGFNWKAEEPTGAHFGAPKRVPLTLEKADDEICNSIFTCEKSNKNYRLVPLELKLHRQLGLPLPTQAPQQRHLERMLRRNPRAIFNRNCSDCSAPIETSFPDASTSVLCESCYQRAII